MEAGIGALQQPPLLACQGQRGAIFVQHRDPAEQHRVHHDRVPVPRHPQRHLLVDLEQRRVGIRRHQVVEDRRHLGEQFPGALQRRDGICKIRRGGIVGDRGDLGCVVGEGLLECGEEMFRINLREWRRLERRLPRLQERVFRGLRGGGRFLGF
jgi:hypothetical protein